MSSRTLVTSVARGLGRSFEEGGRPATMDLVSCLSSTPCSLGSACIPSLSTALFRPRVRQRDHREAALCSARRGGKGAGTRLQKGSSDKDAWGRMRRYSVAEGTRWGRSRCGKNRAKGVRANNKKGAARQRLQLPLEPCMSVSLAGEGLGVRRAAAERRRRSLVTRGEELNLRPIIEGLISSQSAGL